MRALGYLLGAAVSLAGGLADVVYINVDLVPRMLEKEKPIEAQPKPPPPVEAIVEPPPIVEPPSPVEAIVEPPPPVEIAYERALTIRFKTGSSELEEQALERIAALGAKVKRGRSRLRVDGYADVRGPESFNQDLSERRALAVAAELEQLGIARGRIERRAFGERMASEKKWSLDRRVEISIGGAR